MKRFWVSLCHANGAFDCVVIVDAETEPAALEQVARVLGRTPTNPLALEVPPSEARHLAGSLNRRLSALEVNVLDPGAGMVELDDVSTARLKALEARSVAAERRPS